MSKFPNIPSSVKDPGMRVWMEQVRGRLSNAADNLLTPENIRRMNGLLNGASNGGYNAFGAYDPLQDFSIPDAPTNFAVVPTLYEVVLSWDGAAQRNVAYTEIWRNEVDDLETAVLHGTSYQVYPDYLGSNKTFYYWIRFMSYTQIPSAWADLSGTEGSTPYDPAELLAELSGQITETQLYADLNTRIDLVDSPVSGLVDRLAQEVSDRVSDVAVIQAQVDALVIDTDIQILFQPTPPSTALAEGSLWYDTDDENHPHILRASVWTSTRDLQIGVVATNLSQEIIDRADADSAQITRIDSLESTVFDVDSGVAANSTATGVLDSRVTTAEGNINTNAADIVSLESTVFDPATGVGANSSGLNALTTRVDTAEGTISTHSSDITALESTVNNPTSGVNANSSGLNALTTRVDTAEGTITSQSSDITALENSVNHPSTGLGTKASSTALNALDSRVTTAEGNISTNASNISLLEGEIDHPSTGLNARATIQTVDAIDVRLGTAEGNISSQASSISTIQTEVNDNYAAIQTNATSIDGVEAQYSVKLDVNGNVAGFGLSNTQTEYDGNIASHSEFIISVDRFAVVSPGATSMNLVVDAGRVVMDGAFIQNATINDAQIGTVGVGSISGIDSTFVLSTIGTGNITNAYIGDTIESDNFDLGVAGWQIDKNGSINANAITIWSGGVPILSSGEMAWAYVGGTGRPSDGADVTGDHQTETRSDNLIIDYDFELDGTDYWDNSTKSTFFPRTGTQYLEIIGTSGIVRATQTQRGTSTPLTFAVEPGEVIYYSGWVRTTNNSVGIGFWLKDEDGVTSFGINSLSTTSNSWAFISGEYTIPSGIYFLHPFCFKNGTGSGRFDRIEFARSPRNPVIGTHNPVTSGNASTYIADLAVDTLQVAKGAVSAIETATQFTDINISVPAYGTSTSKTTGVSVESPTLAANDDQTIVQITFTSIIEKNAFGMSSGDFYLRAEIYRNAVLLDNVVVFRVDSYSGDYIVWGSMNPTIVIYDDPGAGTHDYEVRWYIQNINAVSPAGGLRIEEHTLAIQLAKR